MQTIQVKVENTFLSAIETVLNNLKFIQDFSASFITTLQS